MNKALVTGATGFIGRHALQPLLDAGYEVYATTSGANFPDVDCVQWRTVDLLNEAEMRTLVESIAPTHLLHFAWFVEHGKFWAAEENALWLEASDKLFDACIENGCQRIVSAGTCAEYDWTGDGVCKEDETPCNPATLYGQSKHELHERLNRKGVSYAWGRIFFLFGPCESPNRLVPAVIIGLLNGEEVQCSDGEQIRDFLYSVDIAEAFVALLLSEVTGAINIGSGDGTLLKNVLSKIGLIAGNSKLIKLGALPPREGDPAFLVPDVGKLQNDVGWRSRFSLDEGLRLCVEWWGRR